jgi:hypothetical protein
LNKEKTTVYSDSNSYVKIIKAKEMSVASIILAILILLITLLKPSRKSWRIGSMLAFCLLLTNFYNYNKQKNLKDFVVTTMSDMATRIYWEESTLSVNFATIIKVKDAKMARVQLKLFPRKSYDFDDSLPKEPPCLKDVNTPYKYLTNIAAENLYTRHKNHRGDIYLDEEEMNGIEHLFYSGSNSIEETFTGSQLTLKLIKAPDTLSKFSSLSKLNNTYIIGVVGIDSDINTFPTDMTLKLKTNAGIHVFHFPFQLASAKQNESKTLPLSNTKIKGICIPEGFFVSPSDFI